MFYPADEEDDGERPLTKRQRKRAKQAEEERIRAAEQRQLEHPAPQSVLEFERLVRFPSLLNDHMTMLICLLFEPLS